MLRYQLKNTIYTPAMAAAILVQCFFMMVGLYPKANADMVYNLQQSMTLGYGWLFISVTSVVPLCFFPSLRWQTAGDLYGCFPQHLPYLCKSICTERGSFWYGGAVGACLLFTIICGIWSSDMTPFFGVGWAPRRTVYGDGQGLDNLWVFGLKTNIFFTDKNLLQSCATN